MATKNNVVTVACKLPNGLLLRNFKMVDDNEVTPTGYRAIKRAEQVGETVQIHGAAVPKGETREYMIIGGYALTPNVDKDFFDEWMRQNKDHPAIKGGLIFANTRESMVTGQAKEQKAVLSGLEPLNPERSVQNGKTVYADGRVAAIAGKVGIGKADVR
ncbi:hypothetical protein BRAS3843_2290002 [Bradyrhizobium sp. STM 3843]|uniref:hypothetical protein n=1 Tax=Bradyrhizobium sp. STM 3843 TaxID=551947 RepID=UPI0002403020|nr:hypothetical protein [Bradyrhizobium sp. STM 3843]CCE07591.1 hypothetical protein BRAS3843_2290002 [Bradyrhizobium sp. STM 3843]